MTCFIDTSGLLAVLDAADQHHHHARGEWIRLVSGEATLVCTNYILLETAALAQHRLGLPAVHAIYQDVLPVLHVEYVDEPTHMLGVGAILAAARRGLSLVDCVSFEVMRRRGIQTAFTFDQHFAEQAFHSVP